MSIWLNGMQNNVAGALECWVVPAHGCPNVLVIEGEIGTRQGIDRQTMGRVRAQFSTPVSIQRLLYSIPWYAELEACVGCDYRPQGYLFCATSDKQAAYLNLFCGPITPGKRNLG